MSKPDPFVPPAAPFTPEETEWLNNFFSKLSSEQILWLEGYMSGLRSGKGISFSSGAPATGTAQAPAPEAPAAVEKPRLTILYGSESGNAEELADQTAKTAEKTGFKVKVLNMADEEPKKLEGIENLLILVSTWGEGDPPEDARDFYEAFMGDGAPRMDDVRYSVLGLGDTSYEHFCQLGKEFDSRLEALGARRIFPRQDCDVDYDEDYAAWSKGALAALEKEVLTNARAEADTTATGAPGGASAAVAQAPEQPEKEVKYSRSNPFHAKLKERALLNGRGSSKETIHLEFELNGSGLSYEVGDALAVIPHNADDVVDAVLEATQLDPTESVEMKEGEFPLREALSEWLDITGVSLPVLRRYNEIAQNKDLEKLLQTDNEAKAQEYLQDRELIDVLHDFPASSINGDTLVSILRKLPPRLYSIASSPKAHPGEVHLTVGVVRFDSYGRQRKGVCSTYLADLIQEGDTTPVYIAPNKNFKLPKDPDTPIIMVGPGTGIAPFRAFLEERKATGAQGRNWLFFGEQHYLTDFLYQLEWQEYLKEGVLTRLNVAFSRDQKEKLYVQDRLLENSKDVYAWLEEGASFYLCGDATRMAVDVDNALHEIIRNEGGLNKEDAAAYVKKLKSEKRYLRDVY
ncbi:MAG: assimilatory sulfite reductase (NADPH) flavoprotein subunit [Opitutales bacterium]